MSLHALVIAASHRPASLNRTLATLAAKELECYAFSIDFPPYEAFDLPLFNDESRQRGDIPPALEGIASRINLADALVIACPEYNWSYPGSLKNMIDWVSHLSPCPLAGKPALLMSATPSRRGGMMGLAHLKTVLEALGMYVLPSSYLLAEANQVFTPEGKFLDPGQQERLAGIVSGFSSYVKALHGM